VNRIGHILLAIDGSEGALAAAELAGMLALNCNSRVSIVIVHSEAALALPALTAAALPGSMPFTPFPKKEAQKHIEGVAEERIFPPAESALGKVPGGSQRVQLWGHAAEEICRYAKENDVDMIVVGGRGAGSFKSLMIGGTGSHIINHAHCAVAVAR